MPLFLSDDRALDLIHQIQNENLFQKYLAGNNNCRQLPVSDIKGTDSKTSSIQAKKQFRMCSVHIAEMGKYQNLFKSVNFTTHLTDYGHLINTAYSTIIVLLLALQTHVFLREFQKRRVERLPTTSTLRKRKSNETFTDLEQRWLETKRQEKSTIFNNSIHLTGAGTVMHHHQ